MNEVNTHKWILAIFKSTYLTDFLAKINLLNIANESNYKSYFGLNVANGYIISLKCYFTFFREITLDEIALVLGKSNATLFYHEYVMRVNDFDVKKGGSGYTFTIKFSPKKQSPAYGLYFKIAENTALGFNALNGYEQYVNQYQKPPVFDGYKLIYKEFDIQEKLIDQRDLYYVKDPKYKQVLASIFNEPYIIKAHEIEYCSSYQNKNYKKINLLMDLMEFEKGYQYTSKGMSINTVLKTLEIFNTLVPVCPGFYVDNNINSIYLLNTQTISQPKIKTVEDIVTLYANK